MPTYDPALVSVIADTSSIVGFSGGTPITVARSADQTALKKGMKDASAWNHIRNSSGLITLVLLGSHPDNDILMALALARAEFPMMIKDNSGRSLAFGESCKIQKIPDKVYGDVEVQDLTWNILVADLELFNGGNT